MFAPYSIPADGLQAKSPPTWLKSA